MQQRAFREPPLQAADQLVRQAAFGRADRVRIPLVAFKVVDGNKGRLAAHRQAHVARCQLFIDQGAEFVQRVPLILGKRFGNAWVLGSAPDLHVKGEFGFRKAGDTGNRGGVFVVRGGGQRNMAFARQQTRGGIEAHPAGAGQVNLDPGVQICKIFVGALWPVDRHQIGL